MMVKAGAGLALAALMALAGCGQMQTVARAADPSGALTGILGAEEGTAAYDVTSVEVVVPRTLRVSEANSFVPLADIVWHGDPFGDRYAQVQSVIEEAARRGTAGMTEGPKVTARLELLRFHALTPKARYTFGGNFATRFLLTVRDAATGAVVDGPRLVVADCPASGGQKAMEEEARGITERIVIVDHVSQVIARELSRPHAMPQGAASVVSRNAFQPADLGIAR